MWEDPRFGAGNITLNRGLICFMLEEHTERELSKDLIEKVADSMEREIIHRLGWSKPIIFSEILLEKFFKFEETKNEKI